MGVLIKTNSVALQLIELDNKSYELNFPLRCLLENEEGYYVLTSEMLDIVGTGTTEETALKSLSQEFDFIYQRYNQLSDDQLSDRLKNIKKILNITVKKINNGGIRC
jgi:hypothetical protein